MADGGSGEMLGCLFAIWLLFVVGVMFLFILAAVIEYPQLGLIAVGLGFWWLARRVGTGRVG